VNVRERGCAIEFLRRTWILKEKHDIREAKCKKKKKTILSINSERGEIKEPN
jgi:hypothetical protein